VLSALSCELAVQSEGQYVPVLARKPGALRNGAPFKDWVLPAAMERIRRRLAGADDGNRQMVDILTAVLGDGAAGGRSRRANLPKGISAKQLLTKLEISFGFRHELKSNSVSKKPL